MPAVSSRVAIRYAKSLLGLADEKGLLEEVKDDMQGFVKINDDNRDLELLMQSPLVPHVKKMGILKSIFEGKVNELTYAFFHLITKKNREEALYAIATAFLDQYNEKKGIQKAYVSTPVPLSEVAKKQISDTVLKMTGKQSVILNEEVDESLIGGYILRVEDRQIDSSLKSSLINIKNSLKNSN